MLLANALQRLGLLKLCLILVMNLFVASALDAAEPLTAEIDRIISASAGGELARQTTDAEFVRRVTLDLAGKIPSAEETRKFLADTSTNKREALIDQLLASPDFVTRMTDAFHVMLMERLGEHEEWTAFLKHVFEQNVPWNEVIRQVISPDPKNEATRGSAFFFSGRLKNYGQQPVDLPGLTRDVGRLFLGLDVQCAQCHDHPQVETYKQEHYQGLFAFVGHTYLRKDVKYPAVGEKLMQTKIEFESVFVPGKKQTGPRLPGGTIVEIPTFKKGEEYEEYAVAPDKKTRAPGVPKFSPLKILSDQLTSGQTPSFSRNAVNRFWFLLMGRGIVDPLDMHHIENPPSHPELLDLLAKEFESHKYDVKWLLKQIAMSAAYQRSSELSAGEAVVPADRFRVAMEKSLSADQLLWSMLRATGEVEFVMVELFAAEKKDAEGKPLKPTSEKLDDYRGRFLKAFANPPREPEITFAPSVKAALFLLNDTAVTDWFLPKGGNLVSLLSKLKDDGAVAEELYLSVLSRLPDDEERAAVSEYLKKKSSPEQRTKALGNLAWSLMASTEFCLNH